MFYFFVFISLNMKIVPGSPVVASIIRHPLFPFSFIFPGFVFGVSAFSRGDLRPPSSEQV